MRLIYQTTPQPAVSRALSDVGVRGTAYLKIFVYDLGEPVAIGVSGHPRARPLSYWRQGWNNARGRAFIMPSGPLDIPPASIPGDVLDVLSDDATVEFQWIFVPTAPGGGQR